MDLFPMKPPRMTASKIRAQEPRHCEYRKQKSMNRYPSKSEAKAVRLIFAGYPLDCPSYVRAGQLPNVRQVAWLKRVLFEAGVDQFACSSIWPSKDWGYFAHMYWHKITKEIENGN